MGAYTTLRPMSKDGLTFFFPMFNEEDYLRQAVDAAREAGTIMEREGEISDYEILIVNDASTDSTGARADALSHEDRRIRVVHHPVNRRLGGTLKTGFSSASKDVILYSDADLPFDMMEARKAYRLMRIYKADIVAAYRHDRTGEGPRRALYSYVYNFLIRTLFGLKVRDVNFAFKLVRRRIFDHVRLKSEGSFIDAELLIRAQRLGYKIVQFGTDYFPRSRGVSTLSGADVILSILREMVSLKGDLKALCPLPPETLAR